MQEMRERARLCYQSSRTDSLPSTPGKAMILGTCQTPLVATSDTRRRTAWQKFAPA